MTPLDVLIVEDSPTQAMQLEAFLEERGLSIASVCDGAQAIRFLEREQPRLVISDIVMPHLDGYDLCRRIKADERLQHIPVVLWTQLPAEDLAAGRDVGALAIIRKPSGEDMLYQTIQQVLDGSLASHVGDGYVLIVEDSPTQAAALEETLREEGYLTKIVADGRQALDEVRGARPILIVSDIRMPIMDGFELCRSLKQDPELSTIPVILLTSLSSAVDVLSALEAGADFYIPKSCRGDYLLKKVGEILTSSRQHQAPTVAETVTVDGTAYRISASREQLMRLMLSTYEVAIQQNRELEAAREQLESQNLDLEKKVRERTVELTAEIGVRERAESTLRAQEQYLQFVSDHAPVLIAHCGRDRRYKFVNQLFANLFTMAPHDIVGRQVQDLVGEEAYAQTSPHIDTVLTGESVEYDIDMTTPGSGGRVFRVNCAPEFDGAGTVVGFVAAVLDVTERKKAETALRVAVQEREVLLQEVHHRVKNNLQVISSLLGLESDRAEQPSTTVVLGAMQSRIRAMALLHECLYRSGQFAWVDLHHYLDRLAIFLERADVAGGGRVRILCEAASIRVAMDQAIPCGLITTELVANAFKHGFADDRAGDVVIELRRIDDGQRCRLSVRNTGAGLPEDFDLQRSQSLGLHLVSVLARQLGGRLEVDSGTTTAFSVAFPVVEPLQG